MGRSASRVAVVLLAMAAGTAAVLANAWLFPLYSLNRDDSVYVAMARLIEHGAVTLPAGLHDAFRPWASAVVGDRIVLKYTPPWPALLAAGHLLTGSMRAAPAAAAATTVVLVSLLAGEVLRDRTAAVVAGVLLAVSPVFVVLSGTYLPYVFQLALGLGAAVLLLGGVRRGSTARVVVAGAVLGVAGWARPYDALLVTLPFVVLGVVERVRARRHGEGGWSWPGLLLRLAAGAVPVGVVVLVYDTLVMGSPLRLPYTVTGPQDGFGFGRRGVFPQYTIDFTPQDGVSGLVTNLRWVPSWTAGGIVLVILAGVGLARTRGSARWAVAALAVVVPLGYLPFWGPYAMSRKWPGVELFGFFYFLPLLVPLVVFGAAGLVALARTVRTAPWVTGPVFAAVVAVMVFLTVTAVPDKVAGNLAVRDDFRVLQRFVDRQVHRPAILFLPDRGDLGFESTTPFLENSASLDQPVLYAEERGPADFELLDRYPDRAAYRLSQDVPRGELTGGRLAMDRLHVETGPLLTLRLRMTAPTEDAEVVAYLDDGTGERTQILAAAAPAGNNYDVEWTLAGPALPAVAGAVAPPAEPPSGVLRLGLSVRGVAGQDPQRWEQRIPYRVIDGGAQLQLLRPGTRWTRDAGSGAAWRPATALDPVADVG